MGTEDAGGEGHQTIPWLIAIYERRTNPLGNLGRIGMGNTEPYHPWARREPLLYQCENPGFHVLPPAHPLQRNDSTLRIQ